MKHILAISYRQPATHLSLLPNEHDSLENFLYKASEDRLLQPILIERNIDLCKEGMLYYVGEDKITLTTSSRYEELFMNFKRVDDGYFEFCGMSELISML